MHNRLAVVAIEQKNNLEISDELPKVSKRQAAQIKFDQLWLDNPKQFDPQRNCIERKRLEQTFNLIKRHTTFEEKRALDLGCASGVFSKKMAEAGAIVDAVDIAETALSDLRNQPHPNIRAIQDYIPKTLLEDDSYDLVVSTNVIAYLPKMERRLYFAELARLVKPGGYVVCSTDLDVNTEGALEAFVELVETEFIAVEWTLSYHAFLIGIKSILKIPARFAKGSQDPAYRLAQLNKRSGLSRFWYRINSSKPAGVFWYLASLAASPILRFFNQNNKAMDLLEKMCRFFKSESGISNAILIAKRRPLITPSKEELMAIEPKHKKQVWE